MKLSSGKYVYANGNIFGLTPDLRLTEGYDSYLFDDEDEGDEPRLNVGEKQEIADEMISRWQAYKRNL